MTFQRFVEKTMNIVAYIVDLFWRIFGVEYLVSEYQKEDGKTLDDKEKSTIANPIDFRTFFWSRTTVKMHSINPRKRNCKSTPVSAFSEMFSPEKHDNILFHKDSKNRYFQIPRLYGGWVGVFIVAAIMSILCGLVFAGLFDVVAVRDEQLLLVVETLREYPHRSFLMFASVLTVVFIVGWVAVVFLYSTLKDCLEKYNLSFSIVAFGVAFGLLFSAISVITLPLLSEVKVVSEWGGDGEYIVVEKSEIPDRIEGYFGISYQQAFAEGEYESYEKAFRIATKANDLHYTHLGMPLLLWQNRRIAAAWEIILRRPSRLSDFEEFLPTLLKFKAFPGAYISFLESHLGDPKAHCEFDPWDIYTPNSADRFYELKVFCNTLRLGE